MKLGFKKHIAAVLSASIVLGSAAVSGFAADFSLILSEVGYVYDYVDTFEQKLVDSAKGTMLNFVNSSAVKAIVDDKLETMPTNVTSDEVGELLVRSLATYLSNSTNFSDNLNEQEGYVADIIEKLFGEDYSEEWFELFFMARKDSQLHAIQDYRDRLTWATGVLSDVYDTMDRLQVESMDERLGDSKYEAIATKLAELGWTSQKLVDACRDIMSEAFGDSHVVEFALIKAAARSAAELVVDGSELELSYAGLDLDNEDNVLRYSPDELPLDINLSLGITLENETYDVTEWVDYVSANSNTGFERIPNGNAEILKVTLNEKGTNDIKLHRISGENDWIVKFRTVVAYDIDKVTYPTVALDGSALTWNPVDHAVKYVVNIYKDGNLIDTVEVTDLNNLSVDFSTWAEENGNGDYSADVTAYGDIPEEVGETSEISDVYSYTASLDTVSPAPVWKNNTTTLSWNSVTGAAQYIIKVYSGNDTDPIIDIVVDAVDGENIKDLSTELADKYGTFYATVQAINGDVVGGVSDKSSGLLLEKKYLITGIAQLEGAEIDSVRDNNSGIKVSILQLPNVEPVYTNAAGEYTFPDKVPHIIGGYTLIFEKTSYLKTKVLVDLDTDNVVIPDAYLYYGNFYDTTKVIINHFDLGQIITYYGADVTDENADLSIGDDDQIDVEFDMVLRNYGKKFDN